MPKPAPAEPPLPSRFSQSRRDLLCLGGTALVAPAMLAGCLGDGGEPGGRTYADTIARSRVDVESARAGTDTSAISVALVDGERIAWAEAFGWVDQDARIAADATTMFAIGSVSKVVAAIATMILVDRGLVELDAPLARYLPDFRMASPEYSRISVRMLLSHASGLPGTQVRNIFATVPVPTYAAETKETLASARLKHAPGEMAVYCNDGFTLIELLVAAVSGRPFAQFVDGEILAPLGMVHSRYPLAPFPDGAYAPPYRDGAKLPQEFVNAHASGGLYSTPSDMARLAMMLMNDGQLDGRRVLSAPAVAEMGRDQTASLPLNPVPTYRFGLGWDGVAQPGLAAVGIPAWHKNGGTSYYGSEFWIVPGERLAVMITGTSLGYGSQKLAESILLRALVERGTLAALPEPLPAAVPPARVPTDAELAAVVGCYDRHDLLLRVAAEPDRTLTLSAFDAGRWSAMATGLRLRADGTFSADDAPLVSYRPLAAGGRTYLVRRTPRGLGHYLMDLPWMERIAPAAPLSPAWTRRTGRVWLAANDNPRATQYAIGLGLDAVPELPGFIATTSGQVVAATSGDSRATMFLKIPQEGGRDLDDVVVELRGGEEWLRYGSLLLRPQASAPALGKGTHAVPIDADGHAQWRQLPPSGRVAVGGCSDWKLYDDNLVQAAGGEGSGAAPLPGTGAAAWLVVFGRPATTVTVTVA